MSPSKTKEAYNQGQRPASLRIGLQCGASDRFSAFMANPALGAASDLLVGLVGTAILWETPEIYGTLQLTIVD